MKKYVNTDRPPFFCQGCTHARVVNALDKAFDHLNLKAGDIVIVSDIGCAGLFDTFFKTHAFHGLHGRALTYAIGIKLANPTLTVVVVMGDGGIGIGGAHLLSACKKNIGITLLILNNFNYGMTGGQFSATTPSSATVNSAFLNQLEKPLDICQVSVSAGASFVQRISAYHKDLPDALSAGISHDGFSIIDIWGVCVGRYTKHNRLNPSQIDESLNSLPSFEGIISQNVRTEFTRGYKEASRGGRPIPPPMSISAQFNAKTSERQEIMILGNAGQRVVTAGDILCIAGMLSGLYASQKSDYPVTVLRGHSVGEVVLSPNRVDFSGIIKPNWVFVVGKDGANRKKDIFSILSKKTVILKDNRIEIPPCRGKIVEVDFEAERIKYHDRALAMLIIFARMALVIDIDMLMASLRIRFSGDHLNASLSLVNQFDSR